MSTKRFVAMRSVNGAWHADWHYDTFEDAASRCGADGGVIDTQACLHREFWTPGMFGGKHMPDDVRSAFEAREF